MPPLHGTLAQTGFFIYAACDSKYFDEFGRSFINSVLKNTTKGIHVHIFNPSREQLDFCNKDARISVSYEYVVESQFVDAAARWHIEPDTEPEHTQYTRTLTAMKKGHDISLLERIQKTYYACARFIRLKDLTTAGNKFLAVDIDAIIRAEIPMLSDTSDCYMYKITGKKARVLAGGLYSTGNVDSNNFINEYAGVLLQYINNDYIYWSLDQDVLDNIVPKYNIGDLPYSLIDWEMLPNSIVWTAKGKRKDLDVFQTELKKYK